MILDHLGTQALKAYLEFYTIVSKYTINSEVVDNFCNQIKIELASRQQC